MQSFVNFINDVLSPISVVIGIITFFPILWIWWDVSFGRKRRHKRWFEEVRKPKAFEGQRHGILIADLHPQYNIRTSVEAYTSSTDLLKSISSDRIFQVSRERWLGPDDMPDLVKEIRERAAEVVRAGVDVLHLFYAGPVIPPAIIGAVFANTCLVMLYQHTQQGGYVDWGPLRHDAHESS